MKRRSVVTGAALIGVAAVGTGMWWLPAGSSPAPVTLGGARQVLAHLKTQALVSVEGWSPAQVFNHCAQSIEYSMLGYPQLKPAWFRQSVGPAAFAVFQARGVMQHALDEAIPGAETLNVPDNTADALVRLEAAFETFAAYAGTLQPHFAYGELDHGQYATAHVLHLYNHLSRIRLA